MIAGIALVVIILLLIFGVIFSEHIEDWLDEASEKTDDQFDNPEGKFYGDQ